jgi:hypothetical protein
MASIVFFRQRREDGGTRTGIDRRYQSRDERFGNGREVRNFYENAIGHQALRLAMSGTSWSKDDLRTLTAGDMKKQSNLIP